MIPWYKKAYQIREEIQEVALERGDIMYKMGTHFDRDTDQVFAFESYAKNPYAFDQLDKNRFTITHTRKRKGGKDPSIPTLTSIKGHIEGVNRIIIIGSLPLIWNIAFIPSILLTNAMGTPYLNASVVSSV